MYPPAMGQEVKRKRVPRVPVAMKIRPETIEMLRRGAAYHGIGYHTYAQWLIEHGLTEEARYYGWVKVKAIYTRKKVQTVAEAERQKGVRQLIRVAERKNRRQIRKLKPAAREVPPKNEPQTGEE